MLRFHKFTVGYAWCSDFGNPDKKEDFEYNLKFSPLHTIPQLEVSQYLDYFRHLSRHFYKRNSYFLDVFCMFLDVFERFWTFSGRFLDVFWTFSEHFLDIFWTLSGHFLHFWDLFLDTFEHFKTLSDTFRYFRHF